MSYTHEMSPYELQAVYEEAHYHQCISDIVSLMLEYGDEQVFGDIKEMLLKLKCIMQPPTEVIYEGID